MRLLSRFLQIIILLCVSSTMVIAPIQRAYALDIYELAKDDSCRDDGTNVEGKIASLVGQAATFSLPFAAATFFLAPVVVGVSAGIGGLIALHIIANFSMHDIRSSDGQNKNPDSNHLPEHGCNQPLVVQNKETFEITFCYTSNLLGPGFNNDGINSTEDAATKRMTCKNSDLVKLLIPSDGSRTATVNRYGSIFFGERISPDVACIFLESGFGPIKMGCRTIDPPAPNKPQRACFVSPACVWGSVSHHSYELENTDYLSNKPSKNPIPFTAALIQCVHETLGNIFLEVGKDCVSDSSNRISMFHAFQKNLRSAIMAALTLYVVFFGMVMVLSRKRMPASQIFMFLLKLSLVTYFAVGDGIIQDAYPAFLNASNSLSSIFFLGGGASGLCTFFPHEYIAGFEYLALWDSIDCRIGHYFGAGTFKGFGEASYGIFYLFVLVIPLLFGPYFLAALLIILFGVLFLLIVVYVIQLFIISMMGLIIILFFAPLLVPMALFRATKGAFDNWLKLLFQFSIQPIFISIFLALMLSVMDQSFYNSCKFERKFVDNIVTFHILDDAKHYNSKDEYLYCQRSFGYILEKLTRTGLKTEALETAWSFKYHQMEDSDEGVFESKGAGFLALLKIAIMMFFFYHYSRNVAGLSAELTGGVPIGNMAIKDVDDLFKKLKDKFFGLNYVKKARKVLGENTGK